MKNFKLKSIKKVFIIAEIGINHEGNISTCKKLIENAVKAGANAVKLQTVDVSDSYEKFTSSYKTFKKKNFSNIELLELKKFTNKKKIFFFSTPGDIPSLNRLIKIGVPCIKISSGLMNHYPLIKEAAKHKKELIISTGLSNQKDLIELKNFLKKSKINNYAILKCTSQYPAQSKNLNLKSLTYLKKLFKKTIGYSDHTTGLIAPVIAVSLGAKIIEKHITINSKKKGADHKISLEYLEFKKMVNLIRETENITKDKKFFLPKELEKNRLISRRYIFTKNKIKKGELFTIKNLCFKRTRKKIKAMEPKKFFLINKRKSKFNLDKGIILKKSHYSR